VVEVLDLRIEEKMQETKITFLKVIELVTRMDLTNRFIIEDQSLNKEELKIYRIDLIQQLEEESNIMNQI
jgi:hypothetical protein